MRLKSPGLWMGPLFLNARSIILLASVITLLSWMGCDDKDSESNVNPEAQPTSEQPARYQTPVKVSIDKVNNPSASSLWNTDLAHSLKIARKTGRPLLIVSVLGDIHKKC